MRLIDSDELRIKPEYMHDICGTVMIRVEDIARIINDMPTIEPQKWIPCSEMLPDIKEHHVSEPCIVYCENGAYGFAELEENIFGQVGWNCEREDDYHDPLGNVIAWMSLPPVYKGDE